MKAAQLRRSRAGWCIQALCSIPRHDPADTLSQDDAQELVAVLRRQGFSGNQVVLAVPGDKLLTGTLEVPPVRSGAPVDRIARTELSRLHKVPADSFEMFYWALPAPTRTAETVQVMAAACTHTEANKLLDTFEDCGLDVRALDAQVCADSRACKEMLAAEPAMTAVLDLGWNAARLSIICRSVVVYQRALRDAGMETLSRTLAKTLELDSQASDDILAEVGLSSRPPADGAEKRLFDEVAKLVGRHFSAMGDEFESPFSYAAKRFSQAGVQRLLLIGGGAGIPGLEQFLSSTLQTEVITAKPGDLAKTTPALAAKAADPGLTAAVGLAQFGEV